MNALADTSRNVALELYELLRDLDPSRWRAEVEAAVRRRVGEIESALERLLADGDTASPLSTRLHDLGVLLRERIPSAGLPDAEQVAAWATFRDELQQAYEALRTYLAAWRVEIPVIRPTNYARSAFHVMNAFGVVLLVEYVLSTRGRWLLPLTVAATFWSLEGLRHFSATWRRFLLWIFSAIAHPHEKHRINSSTWFATALTIVGLLFDPVAGVAAVAVMGIGDPAAALIGRRFGKTRLFGSRSLEGTLTFVLVGALGAFGVLSFWHTDLALGTRLGVAIAAAIAGAIAELASVRLDDNFTVPIAAAFGGWLVLAS